MEKSVIIRVKNTAKLLFFNVQTQIKIGSKMRIATIWQKKKPFKPSLNFQRKCACKLINAYPVNWIAYRKIVFPISVSRPEKPKAQRTSINWLRRYSTI